MFSWGMKKMPRSESADFCFAVGIADTLCVNNSWYNSKCNTIQRKSLYLLAQMAALEQFGFSELCCTRAAF